MAGIPALPTTITCPGCSTKCDIKLPEIFSLPPFPIIEIPIFTLEIPPIPVIPELPKFPTPMEFAAAFAGVLPSFTNDPWAPNFAYTKGSKIDVEKPIPPDTKGIRKTVLTYQAISGGTSLGTAPVWGLAEVPDGEGNQAFAWKLIFTNTGSPGSCPVTKGDKK